jgi:O-methyltransferase involved in polyketide biosynthesis
MNGPTPFSAIAGGEARRGTWRRDSRVVGAWSVVIRTVIIDELITRAIGEGVDTVLNLGAGLDTRPYRMALPEDLRWVDVDYLRACSARAAVRQA